MTAVRIDGQLWWTNQQLSSVIISLWFSIIVYDLGDKQ
jgi:hypothetical protein